MLAFAHRPAGTFCSESVESRVAVVASAKAPTQMMKRARRLVSVQGAVARGHWRSSARRAAWRVWPWVRLRAQHAVAVCPLSLALRWQRELSQVFPAGRPSNAIATTAAALLPALSVRVPGRVGQHAPVRPFEHPGGLHQLQPRPSRPVVRGRLWAMPHVRGHRGRPGMRAGPGAQLLLQLQFVTALGTTAATSPSATLFATRPSTIQPTAR